MDKLPAYIVTFYDVKIPKKGPYTSGNETNGKYFGDFNIIIDATTGQLIFMFTS